MKHPPTIVRLNARTMPMTDMAREILAPLSPRLVEIEGASDEEALAACRDADAILIISAYLRGPVIEQLRAGWSETGKGELERLFRRLPDLDEAARGEIRQSFQRYAAKMLHVPLASLREESRSGPPHGLLDALKRLFDLKE